MTTVLSCKDLLAIRRALSCSATGCRVKFLSHSFASSDALAALLAGQSHLVSSAITANRSGVFIRASGQSYGLNPLAATSIGRPGPSEGTLPA